MAGGSGLVSGGPGGAGGSGSTASNSSSNMTHHTLDQRKGYFIFTFFKFKNLRFKKTLLTHIA